MSPCPEHFIVRPGPSGYGETIVPLIAVDQLPVWIQLTGVPRELDAKQARGMVNLGFAVADEDDGRATYEVRLRADTVRAIMNGTVGEGQGTGEKKDDESVAPTETSVSSKKGTRRMPEEKARQTPASRAPAQVDKARVEEDTPVKALGDVTPREADLSTKLAAKFPGNKTAPPPSQRTTRAWDDDESNVASSDLVSTVADNQPRPPKEQPAPEPLLSASRHSTTATTATAGAKPPAPRDNKQHLGPRPKDKPKLFGANPDTIYCRHWCHHGTCKWNWNCRYQHRMPTTHEGLREVGLKDFPTWYLLLMLGSSGGSGGIGGFPGMEGNSSLGLTGGGGGGGSMDMSVNAMRSIARPMASPMAKTNTSSLLSHLGRPPHPAAAAAAATVTAVLQQQHPSSTVEEELRLLHDRMAALLAGGSRTAANSRQKVRQAKEKRDALLCSNVAAAAVSRQQALHKTERAADAPMDIPAGVVVMVGGKEKGKGKRREIGSYDDEEGEEEEEEEEEEGRGGERETVVREGKLVDIE